MSVYIGIIVIENIMNKVKFDQTLKEIVLLLKTHNQEINLSISESNI